MIAPAKKLDYESPLATRKHSTPAMLDQSRPPGRSRRPEVTRRARLPDEDLGPDGRGHLLSRYPRLGHPVHARKRPPGATGLLGRRVSRRWTPPGSFTERDYTHAQKCLRILSGLYGVLRPLDLIQPYRLEMGFAAPERARLRPLCLLGETGSATPSGGDLEASPGPSVLVNLASDEYFRAIDPDRIGARVITPAFLTSKAGSDPKSNGFAAKRARGAMSGWIIRDRVKSVRRPERLRRRRLPVQRGAVPSRSSRLHPPNLTSLRPRSRSTHDPGPRRPHPTPHGRHADDLQRARGREGGAGRPAWFTRVPVGPPSTPACRPSWVMRVTAPHRGRASSDLFSPGRRRAAPRLLPDGERARRGAIVDRRDRGPRRPGRGVGAFWG